jgi:hypothetical protein
MQTKTIEHSILSLEQVNFLLEDMGLRPKLSGAAHLNDEDFAAYVMELCTPAELQTIQRHLDNCPECMEHLNFLYQCEQQWDAENENAVDIMPVFELKTTQPKPEGRYVKISKLFQEIISSLIPSPVPGSAMAKSAANNPIYEELCFGERNDVLLLAAESTENRCLNLRFSTKTLDRGHKLTLSNSKGFYQEVEMTLLGNHLFAEVVLSEAQSQAFKLEVPTIDWPDVTP